MTEEQPSIESVLATAPVETQINVGIAGGTRSSAAIQTVELQGGLKAFFKRGDIDPPGLIGVRREVAAFRVAQLLGHPELLPVTALRTVPVTGGPPTEVAAQELFVDRQESPATSTFRQEQIAQAGVFDAIVANSDRGGHNWLAVPSASGPMIKLIDHELAFQDPGVVNSTFWTEIGQVVPVDLRVAVSDLARALPTSTIADLLGPSEFEALIRRVNDLRATF